MVKKVDITERGKKQVEVCEKAISLLKQNFRGIFELDTSPSVYQASFGIRYRGRTPDNSVRSRMDLFYNERIIRLYDESIESEIEEFANNYQELIGEEVTFETDYSRRIIDE